MNKIIYTLLTIITFSFITTNATAGAEARGSRSCGVWIADKVDIIQSHDNESWLIGYLSGLAIASDKNILFNIDNPTLILWTDNYCRNNPLKQLYDAGIVLFYELKKQKGLK